MTADEWDYEEDLDLEQDRLEPFPSELRAGLAVGFLAMVPLLLAYEYALSAGDGLRSTAELLLFRLSSGLDSADLVRRLLLAALAVSALVVALRRHVGLGPPLLRVGVEGAVAALVLGPVLIGLVHLLSDWVSIPQLAGDPERAPELARAAFVFGAAAHEELLFRVAGYSALYLVARWLAGFFGLEGGAAEWAGELVALFGSAALFAAFHLELFTAWLGHGGEPFDASVFTWRLLAGILLGLLFRWRGPGVAAWAHGLFNLSLLLGAGPDVFS